MHIPGSHFSSADPDSRGWGLGQFYFKQAAHPESSNVHSCGNTAYPSIPSCKFLENQGSILILWEELKAGRIEGPHTTGF